MSFTTIALDERSAIEVGELPRELRPEAAAFERLWGLHPEAFHRNARAGRIVETPRWQKAYGRDYAYAGSVNRADPVPTELAPYLDWARRAVDARLDGVLVNWFDLALRHYIGRHKDAASGLVPGAPIVTISLGASRTFVLERGKKRVAVDVRDGTVVVLPWEVNRRWSHQVPRGEAAEGRRISVTLRAFD
jgi:alkylated DNA repair dioxygenase AlkB